MLAAARRPLASLSRSARNLKSKGGESETHLLMIYVTKAWPEWPTTVLRSLTGPSGISRQKTNVLTVLTELINGDFPIYGAKYYFLGQHAASYVNCRKADSVSKTRKRDGMMDRKCIFSRI